MNEMVKDYPVVIMQTYGNSIMKLVPIQYIVFRLFSGGSRIKIKMVPSHL